MILFPPQASTTFFEEGQIVSESVQYRFIADAGTIAYRRLALQVAAVVLVGGAYLFATNRRRTLGIIAFSQRTLRPNDCSCVAGVDGPGRCGPV